MVAGTFHSTHREFVETLFYYYHLAYKDCIIMLTMICAIEKLVFKPALSSPYRCLDPFADSSCELEGIWQKNKFKSPSQKNLQLTKCHQQAPQKFNSALLDITKLYYCCSPEDLEG